MYLFLSFSSIHTYIHGRRLMGDRGTIPPNKFEVGDGPCIHPPIFWEVLLLDAGQSTNWLRKVSRRNLLFWNRGFWSRKGSYILYIRLQTVETDKWQTKKGRVKFWAVKWHFFPKKGHSKIWSAKFFSRNPQLGFRPCIHTYTQTYIHRPTNSMVNI